MKLDLKQLLIGLLMVSVLFACNNKPQKKESTTFELNGSLEGITEGNVILSIKTEKLFVRDTAKIIDGNFQLTGDYPEPIKAELILDDGIHDDNFLVWPHKQLIIENCKMTLKGRADQFHHAIATGSKKQDDYEIYLKDANKIIDTYIPRFKKLYGGQTNENPTQEEVAKSHQDFMAVYNPMLAEYDQLKARFLKQYPKAYFSGLIIQSKTYGKSAEQLLSMVDTLHADLRKHPLIVEIEKKANEMMAVELGIETIIADASNVSYKVDKTYNGENLNGIVYLAAFKNNNICALLHDGSIQILDPSGKELKKFKPQINGSVSSVSVDLEDKIYVMSTLTEEKEMKIRGKVMSQSIPMGVECHVLNTDGKELTKYALKDMKTASGTRVVDENLMVADHSNKKISMFNKKTGEHVNTIEDMRPCCGILDFSVNSKKELLVANLGAFKVQGYDYNGKIVTAFGKRGKGLDDFHGCCNPVSVASLSNGAIVTVEKDPTRIKVFSKEGAKQIAGIEELVKGCSYIPMIVDAEDNLYLASREKGLVKCVSIN